MPDPTIVELEAQLKGCLASLRASEEALNCRTGELAACHSERDQLLALLAALKLRCPKPMKDLQCKCTPLMPRMRMRAGEPPPRTTMQWRTCSN